MCSIYNYIHLHIHKCIHIELPCLFVVVFAQQNKLSKNCRKGHLIRIFWTAASRFLSAPHPLLRRLVNACGLVFCRWTSSEFSFWKKKRHKKRTVSFFCGGKKKKKGAQKRKDTWSASIRSGNLLCSSWVKKRNDLDFFAKKKSLQDSHSVRICGSVWPPSTNTFRLARKWAFWKSAWLLATLKDLGEIKNHVGSFFGPHGFWEIPIFGRQLSTNQQKMQNTQQTTKKKAGHPSFWRFHWEDRSNKLFASNQAKPCGEPLCDACSYPC